MARPPEIPRFVLRPDPESPRRARELVGDALYSHLDPDTLQDAAVVVSELVTNAVIHANTTVTVGIEPLDGGSVRITVGDSNSWPPTRRAVAPDGPGGRGLVLVDALASRWGVEARDEGKVVWAELEPAQTRPSTLSTSGARLSP